MAATNRARAFAVRAAVVLATGLALTLLYSLGCRYLRWEGAFNSDNLLCTAFLDDVLRGRDWHDWHLPGAPYLFPDVLLLLPCHLLAPTLVGEFLGYCLLQWALVLAVVYWIGRLGGLGRARAVLSSALGIAFLAAVHLREAYGRAPMLVHAGSHTAALLVGLFLLALTVRAVRLGQWRPWGMLTYLLVAALGVFSDKLVVVQFMLPTAIGLVVLAAGKHLSAKALVSHGAIMALALALSAAVGVAVRSLGLHLLSVETTLGWPRWADFVWMLGELRQRLDGQLLLVVLLPVYLGLCLLVLVRGWRRAAAQPELRSNESGRSLLGAALLLGPACNVLALLFLGMSRTQAIDRYLLPCWLLPLLLPATLAGLAEGPVVSRRASELAMAFMALFAIIEGTGEAPAALRTPLEMPYPPLAQELDRLVRQRGPMRGLAGFWEARSLHFLTRERVPIAPLDFVGAPYFHAGNPAAFLPDDPHSLDVPTFRFVVASGRPADSAPPGDLLLACYGEPAERVRVGRDEIWLYDRASGPLLDRFLRARLAPRLSQDKPFTGPAMPACLAQPKPNAYPPHKRGTAAIPDGKSLELVFAGPTSGRLLDIGADCGADCELTFFRDGQQVGRLRLPPQPWHGALYEPPGIQSRLLSLPPTLRDQAFDRVVIRPRKGQGAVLGHLLVFADDLPGGMEAPAQMPSRLHFEAESLPPQVNASVFGPVLVNVEEAGASGGHARRAGAGWDKVIATTPPLVLPPGRYRMQVAIRAGGCGHDGSAAVLTVVSPGAGGAQELRLSCQDCTTATGFRVQSLDFDAPEGAEGIMAGVIGTGAPVVHVDWIDVVRLGPDYPRAR